MKNILCVLALSICTATALPLSSSLDGWEASSQLINPIEPEQPQVGPRNVWCTGDTVTMKTEDGMLGDYKFTLSRTVELTAGESIVGKVRYGTYGSTGNWWDKTGARLLVGDSLLWSDEASNLPGKINVPMDWLIWGRWSQFSFTAPADGDYTLSLVVDSHVALASFGRLQSVQTVHHTPDAGSTAALLALALMPIGWFRRL